MCSADVDMVCCYKAALRVEAAQGDRPPVAGRQCSKPHFTNAHPLQRPHLHANDLAHSANLTMPALRQHNLHLRVIQPFRPCRPQGHAVQGNPVLEPLHRFSQLRRAPTLVARDPHQVFLLDASFWADDALHKT
eukprot:CAMPEP_0119358926 /NCGR_PEP_ID=MMETSP1334-20130426/6960_1 /TAXON_ID=127549 /ORGANISM="Calcidiscus leptoporus, Strain RCC1130" /LENGTH=133 /DNA_ID=CAMNT_0007373493 /DNA_START=237 /DNA_END=639 /DNA_ORIENTATION=+